MRLIALCLALLLLLIQYPLWLGKGGWLRVWDLDRQVAAAQKHDDELKARNAKLASEVNDLKDGTGAVEERARLELGMIKSDEIFVQITQGRIGSGSAPVPGRAAEHAAEKSAGQSDTKPHPLQ
ncbi:MAG: cell division protein FtsB [Burkholderiaceae bacterium]|nr:cell division protein FtsB [Burkholderiaceae bacterium]